MERKLKTKPLITIGVIIILVILIIVGIRIHIYHNSNEYKLGKVGWNEKEINTLLKMDNKVIQKALKEKDDDLIPLAKQKYFLYKNYDKYKSYIKDLTHDGKKTNYKNVVTLVNVRRNYDYYTHTKETNMDLGDAILVNKYYSLPKAYAPKNIVNVASSYGFSGNQSIDKVYNAFKEMADAAKNDGITLIINSGYRSYKDQENVYNDYKSSKGEEYADGIAARPDYSEHQSGLALDIITYGYNGKNFDTSDAFAWLDKNADKYGFILRYPKGKENITGYDYEAWHYRYLGKDLAQKVKKSGLTYDEYYAFYLDK